MGRYVDFPVVEQGEAWCGISSNPCIDCRLGYVGNAVKQRYHTLDNHISCAKHYVFRVFHL